MILNQLQTVRLGIKSLMLHKLRSFLTTLGILIGVAAVSVMLAIAEGGKREAIEKIKALGSTNLLIRSKKPEITDQNSNANSSSSMAYGLKYDDADRIRETIPSFELVVPVREATKEVRVGSHLLQGCILGTNPEYLDVVNMKVAEGRWLTDEDNRRRLNVCVLGAEACGDLFPLDSPLGQSIRVGSERFVIVGVLARLGRMSGSMGPSIDEAIFIPYQVSREWWGDRSGDFQRSEWIQLHEIKIKAKSPEHVLAGAATLRDMFAKYHDKNDYVLTVPLELLRAAEEQQRIWKIVLTFVGGLSLLVGGIGIMNVMLATVTERTREIGIRRALGAKKRNIVTQFLVETVVLSMSGGLIGVAIGVLIPGLITHFGKIPTLVRPDHPLMAFSISAVVGVVFGLYPAVRAANMDPVEALRHE